MYVSNLSFHTNEEALRALFAPFGTVTSAKVAMDKETGKSRGFGFVEMPDSAEGKEAIEGLNDISLGTKPLVVKEAEDRGSSGGGFRGGSNRGGGGGGYNSRPGGNNRDRRRF